MACCSVLAVLAVLVSNEVKVTFYAMYLVSGYFLVFTCNKVKNSKYEVPK